MLAQHFNAAHTPTKGTDLYEHQVNASAFTYILDAPCSESEESSDDSYSSDDSADGDHDASATLSTYDSCPNIGAVKSSPRRPTSLSLSAISDRRASSPSKRSPLYASNTSRSLSHCSPTSASPRTPSLSMRHDAALRAFQQRQDFSSDSRSAKGKPGMVDLKAIPKVAAPRIEIEQVFDDEMDDCRRAEQIKIDSSIADRSAARKRMLNALGRGHSKVTVPLPAERSVSRRMPSLDQISDMYKSSSEEEKVIESPGMMTPGTAAPFNHQRNTSCPTPTSPFSELLAGGVEIIVTPPTPRPQRSCSPICGVRIVGVHTGADDSFFSSMQGCQTLSPPAFELAPGKSRAARERATKALAWISTMKVQREQMQMLCQQQQQLSLTPKQQLSQILAAPSYDLSHIIASPDFIPGTPAAPSLIHIQQQRAILAQQQQQMIMLQQAAFRSTTSAASEDTKSKSRQRSSRPLTRGNSSSQSWRRTMATSEGRRKSGDPVSPADSASGWRRKDVCDATSAKSVYLPPGKRNAIMMQQQQQQQQQQQVVA